MTENAYFSWQEMLVVRIWQISIYLKNISSTNVLTTITSVLHFFWKPLVPIHILFKFGAKEKFSQDFILHNLELFMPGNHVQGGKDKCFVKTTFLFPFFASFMLQESLLMTARRQIYFSWLFKLCSVPPTFVSLPFSFGQILFTFSRSQLILWLKQKYLTKYLVSKGITGTMKDDEKAC